PVKLSTGNRPTAPQPPQPARPARPTLPELPETQADSTEIPETPPEEPVAVADDDAVIVPAPAQEALVTKEMVAALRQRHFVQTLAFKRTIIPPLLTLGAICFSVIILAFVSDSESPFYGLRQWWFALTMALLAILFLTFAVLTIMQVKGELAA